MEQYKCTESTLYATVCRGTSVPKTGMSARCPSYTIVRLCATGVPVMQGGFILEGVCYSLQYKHGLYTLVNFNDMKMVI